MRSIKSLLTALAFVGTLLAAPLAAADRYRGVDGHYYEYERNSSYYDDRSHRRNSYRRSRNNRDIAVAAAIIGTAIIASNNSDRRHYRRSNRSHRSWASYCRQNWRRDARC